MYLGIFVSLCLILNLIIFTETILVEHTHDCEQADFSFLFSSFQKKQDFKV